MIQVLLQPLYAGIFSAELCGETQATIVLSRFPDDWNLLIEDSRIVQKNFVFVSFEIVRILVDC